MRVTFSLDDDVAAAVERVRRDRRLGRSETINELIRLGLHAPRERQAFRQRTSDIGIRVGVSNVAEAHEALDGRPWD